MNPSGTRDRASVRPDDRPRRGRQRASPDAMRCCVNARRVDGLGASIAARATATVPADRLSSVRGCRHRGPVADSPTSCGWACSASDAGPASSSTPTRPRTCCSASAPAPWSGARSWRRSWTTGSRRPSSVPRRASAGGLELDGPEGRRLVIRARLGSLPAGPHLGARRGRHRAAPAPAHPDRVHRQPVPRAAHAADDHPAADGAPDRRAGDARCAGPGPGPGRDHRCRDRSPGPDGQRAAGPVAHRAGRDPAPPRRRGGRPAPHRRRRAAPDVRRTSGRWRSRSTCRTSPLPPVWGDAERLGQLLLNLLHNAVKFSRARRGR